MVALLYVNAIAEVLASKVMNEVEANLSTYASEEWDRFGWMMLVEQQLETLTETDYTDVAWNQMLDSLLDSDPLKLAETTVEVMIKDWQSDQANYNEGFMKYYGLKQSDFI